MEVGGKTVLITGGSAGIGRELARQMLAKGAKVIVTGRDPARLEAMRAEGCTAIVADLSNSGAVESFVRALEGLEIDILVNNAGQGVDHDFREAAPDMAAAEACIHANLTAPIALIVALLPRLKLRPEAAIVNVTSGLAIAPRAGGPIYCATKAGLRSYTMALRKQLEGSQVRVIEALPPVVDTAMTAGRSGKKMSPEQCAREILSAVLQGRAEANIGMVKLLRVVESISPALVRKVMLRF